MIEALALRVQVGSQVYVAIPAEHARRVARILGLGADVLRSRDGVTGLPWLVDLLALLRSADAHVSSEPLLSGAGSCIRTSEPGAAAGDTEWTHDTVTVAEATVLTGWSAGYLCRLARAGLGRKQGGVWHLDADALHERAGHCRSPLAGSRHASADRGPVRVAS